MIQRWNLSAFKSVYTDPDLPFAPLTIFAGVNSSGKSTIIQSILLAAQSLQSSVRERPITLNGHILRLGTFTDVHAEKSDQSEIALGFRLSQLAPVAPAAVTVGLNRYSYHQATQSRLESIDCSVGFKADTSRDRNEIAQLQPALESCRLSVQTTTDGLDVHESWVQVKASTERVEDRIKSLNLSSVLAESSKAMGFTVEGLPPDYRENQPFYSDGTVVGAFTFHFLPRLLLAKYDEVAESTKRILATYFLSSRPRPITPSEEANFLAFSNDFHAAVISKAELAVATDNPQYLRARQEMALAVVRKSFTLESYQSFLTTLLPSQRRTLAESLNEEAVRLERYARNGRSSLPAVRVQDLPPDLDAAVDYVISFFQTSVKYLAPLRDEPKPVYPLSSGLDTTDIGYRGEHTAAVLELNKTREIEYIPSANLRDGLRIADAVTEQLGIAVLDWLNYMGVVTGFETKDLGELGHKLTVSANGQTYFKALTHVGVGVSQVLPIVVLSLLADAGSTLIFEQPELHLHPRVQSKLAEFFLVMTALGKQCIVETHSEHLINKLRHRVALDPSDSLRENIAIYFVQARDGRSTYHPVEMNEYGAIQSWPEGFFDESEELAAGILASAMNKRAAKVRK